MLSSFSFSVIFSLVVSAAMLAGLTYILFQHDRNHEKFEEWVDFSFNAETLRRALDYYRFMAVWMLFTYVAFTVSAVWLQSDGYPLFAQNGQAIKASPISIALFTMDLVLRGGFFDFMQHFDMSLSHVSMYRPNRRFVWYAFLFRMFFGLTMLKILLSFLWIIMKIGINWQGQRRARMEEAAQPRLFD
jgi:hypothetical protein